ncbi:hypothetical protein D3C72_1287700 [compost metagenome]
MRQQRLRLQHGPLQQLRQGATRERAHALLAEHVERAQVERAFERGGQPFVGVVLATGPQAQRAGAHEHLGVAHAARLQCLVVGVGADFLGLRQVARHVDLREAGLDLDERAHGGLERAAGHAAAAVGKGLGVQRMAPRGLQVARVGARVGRRGVQQAVDDVVLAAVALPQQVVRQLVAEHGLALGRLQFFEQRAREHDVRLARHDVDRGVHGCDVAGRGLVERDARGDAQALRGQGGVGMQVGVRVGVEAVGAAQQFGAHGGRVFFARFGRSGPAPGLGFVRLEVGGQCLLVGQRRQVLEANGRERVDHVRSASNNELPTILNERVVSLAITHDVGDCGFSGWAWA